MHVVVRVAPQALLEPAEAELVGAALGARFHDTVAVEEQLVAGLESRGTGADLDGVAHAQRVGDGLQRLHRAVAADAVREQMAGAGEEHLQPLGVDQRVAQRRQQPAPGALVDHLVQGAEHRLHVRVEGDLDGERRLRHGHDESARQGLAAVQETIGLDDGAALILSVANYHGPGGEVIHNEGVEPDSAVSQRDLRRYREVRHRLFDTPEARQRAEEEVGDPFLKQAIEALTGKA